MKLPFDFGVKLIFRLVFPGFFIALGLLPLLRLGLSLVGWTRGFEYPFAVLIIFAGWLITIADMWIYMLFEGRRGWPAPLERFFRNREQQRLNNLLQRTQSTDQLVVNEAYFDLRNFPMDENDEYVARYPSRLGNILTAFERYSSRAYGIDSIFYWPRVWLRIDKDLREEIDSSQALADSTVYTSFAFFFNGGVWLLYATVRSIGAFLLFLFPVLKVKLYHFNAVTTPFLPAKLSAFAVGLLFLAIGFLVYRLSLYCHIQFGELFKSIFDVHAKNIEVAKVIEHLNVLSSEAREVTLPRILARADEFRIAARFLQYQRYRCPKCNEVLKPSEIKNHVCKED